MYGLSEKTIQTIHRLLRSYPLVEKAILYGSRAMGTYRPGSDIDLTLVGERLDLTVLQKIENELDDLLLPYKIDISIMRQIGNADLLEHIHHVGIVFFEKDQVHHENPT